MEYAFLVVEDSPTMRRLISFSLKRIQGARIVEAENGLEALKRLSETKFNLVTTDINMPFMDGLKLLSIIRGDQNYDHLPVIIMTTAGTEADKEKGLKLGANAYFPKPVQTNELLETVRELLKIED